MSAAAASHPPHIPVLLDAVVSSLSITPGESIVDATFGAGGYTRALLSQGARVLAFDRDPDAIAEGQALVAASDGAKVTVPLVAVKSGVPGPPAVDNAVSPAVA